MKKIFDILKDYWLLLIIILQPVLDILAFFTSKMSINMVSLIVRTIILIFIVLYTFYKSNDKKRYVLKLLPFGAFAFLHIINSYRVGFLSLFSDLKYLIMVFQMPVITICFIDYLKNFPEKIIQVKLGIGINMLIIFISVILSIATSSYASTYSDYGFTGWFTSANTQSMVLVAISLLFMYYFNKNHSMINYIFSYIVVILLLFFNGTRACFAGLMAILVFMIFYSFIEEKVLKKKIIKVFFSIAILLLIILNYSASTTFKRATNVSETNDENEKVILKELDKEMEGKIDFSSLSKEDAIKVLQTSYYYKELMDIFGEDKVYDQMKNYISYQALSDNRLRKKTYARIISNDSDVLTKILGFEFTRIGQYEMDLENDLTALFYYYGYLGFALYTSFILYFIFILVKKFRENKRIIFQPEFVAICITFGLILFGAEYTGAFLRKANANIYLSLLLVIIYFNYKFHYNQGKYIKVLSSTRNSLSKEAIALLERLSDSYNINVVIFDENNDDLNIKSKSKILTEYISLKKTPEIIKGLVKKIMIIKEIVTDNNIVIALDENVSQLLNKYGSKQRKIVIKTSLGKACYHYNSIDLLILTSEETENNYEALNIISYDKFKIGNKKKFYQIWNKYIS